MYRNKHHTFIFTSIVLLLLSACSGGGGGSNGGTNTAPSITSPATATVEENTTAVMTVGATDAEGDTVTYSLTGSVDDALFTIGSNSGALSFIGAPDFEAPADINTNNVYDIQVTASDGTLSTSQSIAITVTDASEIPPVFTSSTTAIIDENTTAVMTVNATDAEGDTVTYSLTGSVDDALFTIDTNTGVLSFIAAPDYESPADSGANNVYDIQVTASDGTLTTSQTVNVTVTDVFDMNVISGGVKTLTFSWSAHSGASYYKLLVNPDGASGYSQEGSDIAGTTIDVVIPVHLTDWINVSYMLEAYDASNNLLTSSNAYSVTNLMLSSIGYFKASNTGALDNFGWSIALSGDGNTLAVGARREDSATTGVDSTPNDNATDSGAVYLFRYSGSAWVQQAYLKASNTDSSDLFGGSVALSDDGNTLAVGAVGEDSSTTGIDSTPNDTASWSGAVYLFRYSGSAWSQQAYLKASNTGAEDQFGNPVTLSGDGNTLAVGAKHEDSATTGVNSTPNDSATDSGAVYLFRYSGSAWTQQAYLKASNTGAEDHFGSVALSDDGNTLAVGASGEDSSTTGINSTPNDNTTDSGAVYLFRYSASAWAQQAYIKASNTDGWDYFGSVALSDDGNTLAVGASHEDNPISFSGAVYLFRYSGSAWAQQAYLKASDTGGGDWFGATVALSGDGNALAVGATGEDSATAGVNSIPSDDGTADNSGAAYLFRFDGSNWAEQAYVKASNTGAGDDFAYVALSDDGNTLAVGAIEEDSATTGINSTPNDDGSANGSGAVYLY